MSMSQVGSGLPRLLAERYELSERLASGGMTSVWRGHDRVLGRDVAIKVLHPQLAADPSFRARFSEEAVNAARLTHPNIVALYDTGEQNGVAYIVIEWVEGASLAELLARHGPLPPAKAARLASEVALALDYAHGAGVCHRNLKPANILISEDGTVKVADFSIAKAATEDDPALTGELLGATGHLAPEQAEGDEVDGRADVYGLGACLFEMLTGRSPSAAWRGSSGTMSPRSVRAGVPRELDAVVMRAMAHDPADRYPTAGSMASALARPAAADDGGTRAIVPEPPEPPGPTDSEPEASFIRHEGRWLGWTLVLVGLAAVLVVVGLTLSKTVGPILGSSGKPKSRSTTTAGTSPASTQLRVAVAHSFDPYGDKTENEATAPEAIDSDKGSAWRTEGYNDADLVPYKRGVGLVLDLGSARRVRSIALTLLAPGAVVTVYGAEGQDGGYPPDLESGWTALTDTVQRDQSSIVPLRGGPYRYYLIWFTRLPPDGKGKFRDGIADAVLRS